MTRQMPGTPAGPSQSQLERERLDRATAGLQPPFALVDIDAFDANIADVLERAGATPVRLATKAARCRALQERVLAAGLRGRLCFTLPEALWLADQGAGDLLVAYPTTDLAALRALATGPHAGAVVLAVDDVAQLDLAAGAATQAGARLRVAIDVDLARQTLGGRVATGATRSAVHAPEDAGALAREVVARDALELAGVVCHEAADHGDDLPEPPPAGAIIRMVRGASVRDVASRRGAVAAAVAEVAPLAIVNGGGVGSGPIARREPTVTELMAGSALFGPTGTDAFGTSGAKAAAFFALPVIRKPSGSIATVLGGGYPASGPPGLERLPRPALPSGLRVTRGEGAGEVQTPVIGPPAGELAVGDRVWFRHPKPGELFERFASVHLLKGEEIVDEVPTYRGEGVTFL